MNWLDNYIRKNNTGYLMNPEGGLFVDVGEDYVRAVNEIGEPYDLVEISKSEFLDRMLGYVS